MKTKKEKAKKKLFKKTKFLLRMIAIEEGANPDKITDEMVEKFIKDAESNNNVKTKILN